MKHVFLQMIQTALNRFLMLDPESLIRFKALEGKSVVVQLNLLTAESTSPHHTGLCFTLYFTNQAIEVLADIPEKPDLTISGTPLSLLRLSISNDKRKHFFANDVKIEGNLELGQQVTDLFDQLEIDWEEYLSKWIGDVSAHQMGCVAREIKSFTQRFCEAMTGNINEYVHEEAELFPSNEALQDFFSDVDILRMDVDRAEVRIEKIKRGLV